MAEEYNFDINGAIDRMMGNDSSDSDGGDDE